MRRLRVWFWVVLAACGRPDTHEPSTEAAPAPWHWACEGNPKKTVEHVRVELTPIKLHANRTGPRASQRSRAGHPRGFPQLEEAMARIEPTLRRCWIWAMSRNAPAVTASLSFTVTPFGALEAFSVATQDGRAPELVACLQQTLGNISIDHTSPRVTRMRTRVAFERANDGPFLVQPKPPKRRPRRAQPRVCISVLDDARPDILESPLVYTIDEVDPDDRRTGFRADCAKRMPPNDVILDAYNANRGAFEACYADALDHHVKEQIRRQRSMDPLTGLVELEVELDGIAQPRVIDVKGAGDDALHGCLRKAAADLFLVDRPSEQPITAVFRFELDPQTPPGMANVQTRELALARARYNLARCQARAELLLALADRRPWLDDPRILAETRVLAREAAALPDPTLCIELVDKQLEQLAGGMRFDGSEFRWSQLERLDAVLPIADHVDWGFMLRWTHASTIAMIPERNAEGIALLRALAQTENFAGSLAATELTRYELPHRVQPVPNCD